MADEHQNCGESIDHWTGNTYIASACIMNRTLPRYHYNFMFPFERDFDTVSAIEWFRENADFSIYATSIYVVVVFFLKWFMKDRSRFVLKWPGIIWNFSLAIFSFICVVRILPDLVYDIVVYGFDYTVCDASFVLNSPVVMFWGIAFTYSKIIEFGDTVFIVLRKHPLTVLHMYHHLSITLCVFYLITKQLGPARWTPVINGGVHTIMYTYFALKMLGWKIPKWVSMSITTTQLCQMFFAITIVTRISFIKRYNPGCGMFEEDLKMFLLLVISYTFLFGNYFYQTYVRGKKLTTETIKNN